jgi:hypothetical protein
MQGYTDDHLDLSTSVHRIGIMHRMNQPSIKACLKLTGEFDRSSPKHLETGETNVHQHVQVDDFNADDRTDWGEIHTHIFLCEDTVSVTSS